MGGNHSRQASGGAAVTVRFSVTVRQVREDGSEAPAGRGAGGGAGGLGGAVRRAGGLGGGRGRGTCDHGEREKVIGQEGRELQRRLLQATFDIDSAREERAPGSRAPRGSGTAAWKKATAGAWPACSGRSGSPGWPTGTGASRTCTPPTPGRSCPATRTPWGCGPWRPSTWPAAGSGRPRRSSRPAPASRSAAPSSPASPRTSPPGRATSTRSAPATRKRKSSRTAT